MTDRIIAGVMARVYWVLSRFWRIHFEGTKRHDLTRAPRIYAHWHGDELLLIGAHAKRGMVVLSSHSRDGTRLAWMLEWLGYRVVRGSSTRGGAGGLKGLIDSVRRNGCDASLAVDGPHGPIYRVKPGVVKLAQICGVPLVPGVASARSGYVFKKAWNRCFLPYPLTRCVVLYGDPIEVARDAGDEELERVRLQLEGALTDLKAKSVLLCEAKRGVMLAGLPTESPANSAAHQ